MGNQLTIRGPWLKESQIQTLINAYAAPLAHKTQHQAGGADEITVQGLAGILIAEQLSYWSGVSGKPTTFTPAAHKTNHQDGGSDELDLTGLVGSHKIYMGAFNKNTADASGNLSITGVGFQPKNVILHANISATNQWSLGKDNGTMKDSIYHTFIPAIFSNTNGASIFLDQAAGVNYIGSILSLDADGFTIAWTKTGAKTGVAQVSYWALF